MRPVLPLSRELVLIGGGHSHALVLRMWGMKPLPGVRLTLISPAPTAAYSGMLPGFVAGHYTREELDLDLVKLARFAGARLILAPATGIDLDAKRIHVAGRGPVAFDITSIDVGIHSDLPELPGFAEHGIAAKPLDLFATRWDQFRAEVRAGTSPQAAVLGGGIAGVELAMAMHHALGQDSATPPQITIIDHSKLLQAQRPSTARALRRRLSDAGIAVIEDQAAREITDTGVVLDSGDLVPAALTVGATGARPHGWLAHTGLDMTDGFVTVGADLRSSDPTVFAAGDCAYLSHDPRPKAGVFAVRAAPVLHYNLRAALMGRDSKPFLPQRDYLKLVSLGGKSAMGEKLGLRLTGPAIWRLKDRIDRAFMAKFSAMPAMATPPLPDDLADGVVEALGDKPLCGGCGAKVGGAALSRVLAAQPKGSRSDVLTRPGDDAAVLAFGADRQVLTTDHLRAFTEDPYLMTRITAIHALGDVWAMGAAPQAALTQVTLPRMTDTMQEAWLAEIMEAASDVFTAEGAEIVGGHTATGAELSIGFSVTGLLQGREAITVDGAKAGDVLILTKPIGTGTVLAGEMAMQARGDWVAQTLASMSTPQGAAARLLSGAHAMTDVTGFGLAGHLMAMCDASDVGATLDLDAIPLLPGALALARAGVKSTLYPANRATGLRMRYPGDDARVDLLFDPQTAGGLLAALPEDEAMKMLPQLQSLDLNAALIGRIDPGAPGITVLA